MNVCNSRLGITFLDHVRNRVHQVRLAQTNTAVQEQGVVCTAGIVSHLNRCGFRTLIVFKVGGHSFFVHGFAKNAKANVTPKELKALKALASLLNGLGPEALKKALAAGELVELEAGADGDEGEAES